MSQQPHSKLAGSFKALAASTADTAKTIPISSSDTKPMNDDIQMSTSSSRKTIEANINQQPVHSAPNFDKDNNSQTAAHTKQEPTNATLNESARQQDLEFFRRFLQQSEGVSSGGGGGGSMDELSRGSKVSVRGAIGENHSIFAPTFIPSGSANKSASSSIIDQLMPQIANHSNIAPTYPMPLIYSTFGANFQSGDSTNSLVNALNPNLSSASPLTFYGDFANSIPSAAASSNANRMFLQGSGNNTGGLLDSYSSQLMPGDSGLFGNSSSLEFIGSGQAPTKIHGGPQQRNDLNHSSLERSYSSVLNNPTALVPSSIFDVSRQLAASSNSDHSSSHLNRHLHHQQQQQLNSQAARLFGDSPLATVADQHNQRHQMMNSIYMPSTRSGQLASGRHLGTGSTQRSIVNDRVSVAVKRRSKLPSGPFSFSSPMGEQYGIRADNFGSSVAAGANPSSDVAAGGERFSRKVFVGGLPPDIDEEEIKASFRRFGTLVVDWPHKAESKSYFPPKGYAFLLFQEEASVQALIDSCFQEDDKLYLCVSSPTIKDKPVQIRPWRLCDTDFVLDSTLALDPRKTVFVGGVPRPLKASELANIMNYLYGSVCYAGIDTDSELKYPKGAGRVAFSSHQSYIAAISARFVHIHHSEIEKRVEVKPYVLDDQFCDECHGARCANKFAPFFCANITCLRYYCDHCWSSVHSQTGREFHKPLVKEGGDRPRGSQNFRW